MTARPFSRLLIANRGEIAARVAREAAGMGLTPIVCASDLDAADWASTGFEIARVASYLDADAILAAALSRRADAVHPGYGFLSETAGFAQAVLDSGLVWIGPPPSAIAAMADKGEAKRIAKAADAPVIPGYDGEDQSDARLLSEAERIGWPVLIKAALGGGGRGQRRVEAPEDFAAALASARREALSGFGSDRMILERAIDGARHVEVQVFGDAHGTIVHLGERDCSVQRRNQKIVEEAPAPGLSPETRAAMGAAAVRLARVVGYVNAGTVEFLLDPSGAFFFLEMNTRIQVEHPVTEAVTGLNLIRMQIETAMGRPLPFAQGDVQLGGHAIEARLCAEDPADGYKPQAGAILAVDWPTDVRVDAAPMRAVSGAYDSMIAKIVAHGPTREAARERLAAALERTIVAGLATNRALLIDALRDPDFAAGGVDIGWLTRRGACAGDAFDGPLAGAAARAVAHARGRPWSSNAGRRTLVTLEARGAKRTFAVPADAPGGEVRVVLGEGLAHAFEDLDDQLYRDATFDPAEPKDEASGRVRSPMAGKLVALAAADGARVAKGDLLFVVEAMKMEHELRAPRDGVVRGLTIAAGTQVSIGQELCALTDD